MRAAGGAPAFQILRSHRSVKALSGELQNAMVAPVTPSKTELNRHEHANPGCDAGDRAIRLSVKEYDLLNFLMRGAGRVLER